MPTPRTTLAAAAVAAIPLTLTAAAGWATPGHGPSSHRLPLVERAADGPVDVFQGATRLDGDQTSTIARSLAAGKVKNVILLIGDGMGDSEITVARNYLEGAGGAFAGIDALPLTGQMTHYSVDRETGKPDYTPDSAATGTAWATGVKSYDGAIGVDRHGRAHDSLLDLAKATGRATGDVSTAEIQDATPAVQVASISARGCKGPVATAASCPEADPANGGAGSISEQLLGTRPDVSLGGGSSYFEETVTGGRYAGRTVLQQAQARGFRVVTDERGLQSVRAADQSRPLLGLFAPGNMPVELAAQPTTVGTVGAAVTCPTNPEFDSVPSLRTMTSRAISLLSSSRAGSRNGFFLQVESASIDKRDHAADACGQIGETKQMDEAVQEALQFASRRTDTLVVLTADHAHTSQIVDAATPGQNIKLRTADGADMIVSYNTAAPGSSQQHTGTQLRVAGYGPGAGNVVGLIDQTDLFTIMRDGMYASSGRPGKGHH
ncbi:alkaline phosphatase [Phycicoccus endophyticus]|uniref:Alkaline phosphatase n=1 Tax=Phycicoccus endophyticus TaxID=1690220 RepID=A0A7G9R2C2_9MICO|nr:alkaline phosphatase [Phycicoccus endophyticus]NHI20874.1 alkaline phosphatase [Phycicoccus endophyticus]QNN49747.1 alkaline phosphatase [Phycicoccus endophyticus]GGL34766.1 alkaline phosphatase [Phycicoccus endophyticus]